jgi:methyl-accepting chemotaxis protein
MKLAVGLGSPLAILVALGIVAYNSVGQLGELSHRVEEVTANRDMSSRIETAVEKQTAGVRGFLLAGGEDRLKQDKEGKQEFSENLDKLAQKLDTEEGKKLHAKIGHAYGEFRLTVDREIQLRRAGKGHEAIEVAFSPKTDEIRTQLHNTVKDLVALEDKSRGEIVQDQKATESRARSFVMILSFAGMALGMGVAVLIIRSIARAISRMLAVIQEIANKNLTIGDMEITSEDEIGKAGIALNGMKNSLREVIHAIANTAGHVASASEELSSTSQQITANSEETSVQVNVVSQATRQISQNLQSVATGADEMTSTIQSIATNAHEAATVASNAVQTAQAANATVGKLGDSSAEIGEVIKVITSIAQQTNLLALNATIEAARAGEAGKGFAVVANEVKELAKQTAKATEDISRKITAIQTDTKGAVEAISTISGVINQINDISSTIATAVEEQSATTNEMTRNVADAAKGSGEISNNIEGVAEAARGTSTSAQESQKAADELAEMAVQLRGLVAQFKVDAAKADTSAPAAHRAAKSMAAHAGD